MEPQNYYIMRDIGPLCNMPYPLRVIVGYMIWRTIRRNYYGQGVGRYTDEERQMFAEEAWAALNEIYVGNQMGGGEGDRWVLGGEGPTEADASLYGILVAGLWAEAA